MSSSSDHSAADRQVVFAPEAGGPSRDFWPSIVRIIIVEIVLLLALAAALVAYLNWSSDVAFAEFLAASKMPAAAPMSALHAVKTRPCNRGA